MLIPLLVVAAVVGVAMVTRRTYAAPPAADMAPPTPGGGPLSTPSSGGEAVKLGLDGGSNEQSLLSFILSGGQPPKVASARWYVIGADGALVTTPYGRSALGMVLNDYNAQPAWDRAIEGGASHQAEPRDARRDSDHETAGNFVRKLQQGGAQIVFWRQQLDELAAGRKPEQLAYLSTSNLAGLRSQAWVPSVPDADLHADQVLFA